MPLSDTFWGDRYGRLLDPYGHDWAIATHKQDVTIDEAMQTMQAMQESGEWADGCASQGS
jgi:hypothetical protein